MKKNSTLNIKGKSGQNYVFHLYKLPAQLTSVGGVFMYLKPMKSDFKVLQIRTTHDFKSEMEKRELIKKIGATHIAAIQKNGKAKQDQVLKDIKYLLK